MDGITSRVTVAIVACVALLVAGCAEHAATAAGTKASTAGTVSRALPSPFTITARYTAKSLGLDRPAGLAIGPDGNLYVTDFSQRVSVISPAGVVLQRWGRTGSGPGEFQFIANDPTVPSQLQASITVGADGQVYVSDSGNGRVQVFTPSGRFIREFGSYGAGKGQFLRPFMLQVDSAGDVYVDDDVTETVSKFSPDGRFIWQIGGGSSGDPDLASHLEVAAIDAHGRLVVTADDVNRILYIDSSGHKIDAFSPSTSGATSGHVCDATVDALGNTYVSGCGLGPGSPPPPTGPTLVYDRAHRLIARWPGTTYSLFTSPIFGPDGEVFALAADGSVLRLHISLPRGVT